MITKVKCYRVPKVHKGWTKGDAKGFTRDSRARDKDTRSAPPEIPVTV